MEVPGCRPARQNQQHKATYAIDAELAHGTSCRRLADSATETFIRELDDGLEDNVEHLLAEIDAALRRIEEGTYGTCVVCGRPIGEERLRAVPYATLCIEDKRAQEGR